MANKDVLVVNDKSQERIAQFMKSCYTIRDEGWQNRTRFEEIDRNYMREQDFSLEQQKAKIANKKGDVTKLQNMQVPLVMESVENAASFLSNVFLLDHPMFRFGADPSKEDLALMWNTLVGEDQVNFNWVGEFNQAFRLGAKYNFAPIEVEWKKQIKYKVVNGEGSGGAKLEQIVQEGNCVSALDPYNVIYDPRCPIHKVHMEGDFVGYISQLTRMNAKRYLAELGDSRLKNDVKALQTANWDVEYYVPSLNPDVILRNKNWSDTGFNWMNWATDTAQGHIRYQNMYTRVILYARIMPYEFGIQAPKDQTPDIWKLVAINGVMVYAQPMVNAHDFLPIIINQPLTDNLGHQTKSLAENQLPFQYMTSALWNATLASARRMLTDRMLYNPLLVDPDHINSPNPAAKIPIRPTAYGRKLEEAVYQLPFDDSNSARWLQEADKVGAWGLRANGQNNTSVGQFQKGNKLQDEFNQTMANAGSRERTQAIMWETYGMHPIKTIMKSNYLQFTPKGTKYNREEERTVDINPTELRKAESDFLVGDGLLPIQKMMNSDVMNAAFQTMGAVPEIAAGYEMPDLFAYMMKLNGADKLAQFQKSKEQRNFEMQLRTWQSTAQQLAKDGMKSEDIKKTIGEIPQPPANPAAKPVPAQPGAQ